MDTYLLVGAAIGWMGFVLLFFARIGQAKSTDQPKVRLGIEPATGAIEKWPTRHQVLAVLVAHRAWVQALRDVGHITLNPDEARTEDEACELYSRAWLESAISLAACGSGTGAAHAVLQSMLDAHPEWSDYVQSKMRRLLDAQRTGKPT